MIENDDTGKVEKLPLAERARQGRLEQELSVADIVALEHFTNPAARNALLRAIQQAIGFGDLNHRHEKTPPRTVRHKTAFWPAGSWSIGNGDPPDRLITYPGRVVQLIDREAYRAWRLTCPPDLLSPLSQIHKWLGATPALPESIPPETSLAEKRQRIDALGNAIQAALAVLAPGGNALPRPHTLFDYLTHHDATKTITGVAKGDRALLWIDDNGNEQRLTFSALGKRLDRIRQGG